MSTATEIIVQVEQKRLARFLREHGTPNMHLFVHDGFVCLADNPCEIILLLGEHADRSECFHFKLDKRQLYKWVRAAGVKATIELGVGSTSLVASCDKLGSMEFGTEGGFVRSHHVCFREVVGTVSLPDVRSALRVAPHIDPESKRYALSCIKLEERKAVATNGKSLAICDVEFNGNLLVPVPALKWADFTSAPVYACKVGKHDDVIYLCGDLVCKAIDGRFPRWQQVIPTGKHTAESFVVDAAELRMRVDQTRAAIKAGAREEEAIEFIVRRDGHGKIDGKPTEMRATADFTALLGCELLNLCVPKRGDVTFRCATDNPANHPFVVESAAEPGLLCVVMPMKKETAKK